MCIDYTIYIYLQALLAIILRKNPHRAGFCLLLDFHPSLPLLRRLKIAFMIPLSARRSFKLHHVSIFACGIVSRGNQRRPGFLVVMCWRDALCHDQIPCTGKTPDAMICAIRAARSGVCFAHTLSSISSAAVAKSPFSSAANIFSNASTPATPN